MLKLSAVSLQLGTQTVLHNISFSQQHDEFIGIIGPNGAGKSSLLRLIQRELAPDSGNIMLRQRALARYSNLELAKSLAVVSQTAPPLFSLTVEQVATMGLLPHKSWFELSNSHDKHQVALALQQVGLLHKASQLTDTLSGGELQRLYIARALVQQPALLLLDEPTNHLDVQYQHQILQLTRSLAIPVLACLHDLNLAAMYCDKILLLNKGRQCAFGAPAEVLRPDMLQEVFGLPCEVNMQSRLRKLQVTFMPEPVC
ncbi:ABC transporter ATP-binding protein [Rheinheimera sp. YQF-2]|uniref:ABC transporter ATP-binding protein n=1 Tax=Rheinheimera lutimaris TaxID=2740584 RepID=A0A7Y5AQ21_9GAMM|nr:ABC transporter ATP-binding protein [Rheinheimera lutimaris]NRQ42447.1 ABC transporter ATP-binding protein [Rheinheimera lutimaris]